MEEKSDRKMVVFFFKVQVILQFIMLSIEKKDYQTSCLKQRFLQYQVMQKLGNFYYVSKEILIFFLSSMGSFHLLSISVLRTLVILYP